MENQLLENAKSAIKNWYLSLILGILFIFVGIVVFITPAESYITLSILFSVIFFLSGLFEIVYSISNRKYINNWGWLLFAGIVYLIFGIILISSPVLSMTFLPIFMGFMLLFVSVSAMAFSFDLKSFRVKGWGWLLVLGILGTIFSFIMLWNPAIGGLTIVVWTGITFVTLGIFRIFLAFELKKIKDFTK
ncbi:MAG: HdeD family acid-resistance protein [Bacteroidales bacterium]|jgi:uncharacterized membrane protein HdeD (DUF308 family)|nr:HdeD family acid-resistance protein [Bacteroidales bacterium]